MLESRSRASLKSRVGKRCSFRLILDRRAEFGCLLQKRNCGGHRPAAGALARVPRWHPEETGAAPRGSSFAVELIVAWSSRLREQFFLAWRLGFLASTPFLSWLQIVRQTAKWRIWKLLQIARKKYLNTANSGPRH